MKIRKVETSNYRSCIDTKFYIPENLMALIGVNGVGKSNVLYGLQLFTRSERNRRFYSKEAKEDLLNTQINLQLEIDDKLVYVIASFYYETDERNVDEVYFTEIKFRIEGVSGKKWYKVDPEIYEFIDWSKYRGMKEDSYPKQFQSKEGKFSVKIVRGLSEMSYYSATQFSDPSKCPISIELDDFRMNYRSRVNRNHQQFIYDLYQAYKAQNNSYKLFLNTVGKYGLQLIENIDFNEHEIPSSSYKVRAGGQIQKTENNKRIVVPSILIDGLTLSPNQLSEGTFKTLALVFYILNDNNQILLIEEPEVCVHHGLLNSIIHLVKQQAKHKQIIISTHSDYVLDMLNPENVLLVHKGHDAGTKVDSLTNSLSANDYKVLKDYLELSGNLGEYWKEGGFDHE